MTSTKVNTDNGAPLDLEPIKARLAAATPGPWWVAGQFNVKHENVSVATAGQADDTLAAADAAFITHARTDIAALIEEVYRWRREAAAQLARAVRAEEAQQ